MSKEPSALQKWKMNKKPIKALLPNPNATDNEKAAFAKQRVDDMERELVPLEKHKKYVKMMAVFYTICGNMAFGFESVAHSNLHEACSDQSWLGYIQATGVVFFNFCSIVSSVMSVLTFLYMFWQYKEIVKDSRAFSAWKKKTELPRYYETLDKDQLERRHEAPLSYLGFGIACILGSTWVIAFFIHEDGAHQDIENPCNGNFYEQLSTAAAWPIKMSSYTAGFTCFVASFMLAIIVISLSHDHYVRWKADQAENKRLGKHEDLVEGELEDVKVLFD